MSFFIQHYIPTPAKGVNIKDLPKESLNDKKWRISEKIDGERRLFYKNDRGRVKVYSNTGKRDVWLRHIVEFFEQERFPRETVYDCELVDREAYFAKLPSFIIRSITIGKAAQKYPEHKEDLMCLCFDIFKPKEPEIGYIRDKHLKKLFVKSNETDPVIMVPIFGTMKGHDTSLLKECMDKVESKGGEGLMLMDLDAFYIPGKSKTLIKVKHIEEFIGTILDVELGERDTKIRGGAASLICQVDGCTVPVRVGSGLDNELRYRIGENFEDYIGKFIEIEATGRTRDAKGNISLSFPIFKRIIGEENEHEDNTK